MIPLTTPSQDINENQYQMTHISMQPLCNDSGGQMLPPIPLSQLAEMETQVIASLVQQNNPLDDPPPIQPLSM